MIRLTLDLDGMNLNRAKLKFNMVKFLYPYASEFELRRSSGGKGYHIIAYDVYSPTLSGVTELLADRIALGDDPKRIKKDFERFVEGLPINVLFTQKGGREAKTLIKEK